MYILRRVSYNLIPEKEKEFIYLHITFFNSDIFSTQVFFSFPWCYLSRCEDQLGNCTFCQFISSLNCVKMAFLRKVRLVFLLTPLMHSLPPDVIEYLEALKSLPANLTLDGGELVDSAPTREVQVGLGLPVTGVTLAISRQAAVWRVPAGPGPRARYHALGISCSIDIEALIHPTVQDQGPGEDMLIMTFCKVQGDGPARCSTTGRVGLS